MAAQVMGAVVNSTSRLPSPGQGHAVVDGFTDVHDPALLVPFVDRYFDSLERVWAERTNEMAQTVVTGMYPFPLAGLADVHGVDLLARTDEWLAAHPDAAPALRRLVSEDRDAVRRALAAQAADRTTQP